jgi:hypothetical protein
LYPFLQLVVEHTISGVPNIHTAQLTNSMYDWGFNAL